MLDERGQREGQLLLKLRAFEKDIVRWMKANGNDDYQAPLPPQTEEVEQEVAGVRRSTRNKRTAKGEGNQGMGMIEQLQSGNKDFMSWKNKVKRR